MKGDSVYYLNRATSKEKRLKKLKRAYNKNLNVLNDLKRQIMETEEQIRDDMHCFSIQVADSPISQIIE